MPGLAGRGIAGLCLVDLAPLLHGLPMLPDAHMAFGARRNSCSRSPSNAGTAEAPVSPWRDVTG